MKTKQKTIENNLLPNKNPNDDFYTPDPIAEKIVKEFNPTGTILEPAAGGGAFLRYLPPHTEWCEIDKGRDFFDYNKKVDWIITNPPYSCFNKFLVHSFELAQNVVFLIPTNKVFNSYWRWKEIKKYGGIVKIINLGCGGVCGFPFGFPVGVFHFKKDYKGETKITDWG